MSKSGNNFYYLQDELGSPMYMTGTDGVAISSYAFDDFGRNIDPFTGNRRDRNQKHAYTTNGNIIQPFAFTGYQEDEVSGLKFAQARFYSADNGRFIGEDQVRGFKLLPETQNHYLYCCNEPIEHVDDNGKFVHIIAGAVIGAAVSVGAALVTGAVTGDMPSIGAVAASAVGGAVGGAITAAFPTSIIAGGVGAAASTFVTDNLTNMWGEEDEKKSMGEIVADTAVSGALGAAFGAAQKFELNEKVADGVKDLFHTSGKVNKIIDGVFIGEWRGITTDAPGSWKTNVRDAVRGARSRNGFLGFSKKTWGKALACAFLGEANVVGVVNNTISNVASNIVTNIAKHITGVNSSSIDGYCVA